MTVRSRSFPAFLGGTADYRTVAVTGGGRVGQPWHQHDDEQVVVVLRGEFQLDCEAGSVTLRPGSEHRIAAGVVHRLASGGGVAEIYTATGPGGSVEDEWTSDGT